MQDIQGQKLSFNAYRAKIILLGDFGVGKTSLLHCLFKEVNREPSSIEQSTISCESQVLKYQIDGEEVALRIWDTSGQEKFRSITISFYKDAKGAFLCFDMTNKQSFDNLQLWNKQLKQHSDEHVVKIILGMQADKDNHKIEFQSQEDIDTLCDEFQCSCFIISTLNEVNVKEAFYEMAYKVKNVEQNSLLLDDDAVILKQNKRTDNKTRNGEDNSFCFC